VSLRGEGKGSERQHAIRGEKRNRERSNYLRSMSRVHEERGEVTEGKGENYAQHGPKGERKETIVTPKEIIKSLMHCPKIQPAMTSNTSRVRSIGLNFAERGKTRVDVPVDRPLEIS
jgi:hypothetical protein